jgi:hypothetical protein
MKIGIYGGNGYLGSSVLNALKEHNIEVRVLARDQCPANLGLTHIIDASFPANYKHKHITQEYFERLEKRVEKSIGLNYVYLGSYSSVGVVRSVYGETKKKAEEMVRERGATVLRLGLVVDENNPGGRFSQLKELIEKAPVNFKIPETWCPIKVTRFSDFIQTTLILVNQRVVTKKEVEIKQTFQTNLNFLMIRSKPRKLTVFIPDPAIRIFFLLVSKIPLGLFDNLNSIGFRASGKLDQTINQSS